MPNKAELMQNIADLERIARSMELSAAEFRALCTDTLDFLSPFIDGVANAPAHPSRASAHVAATLRRDAAIDPHNPVQRAILEQLEGGIETASGHFMGYIPGGGILSSALADMITAVTNRFSGYQFAAPGAASAENAVIAWLCDTFGLGPDAWGCLTSGGTMATLNCLLAARESVGATPIEQLVIYLSDQVHHAVTRTLKTLGLHRALIHIVETDADLRLCPEALKRAIGQHRAEGLAPFLAIATAGTTNTGAVDPLAQIAAICAEHGVWMHVDAAYGGLFVLCEEGRHRLDGIEAADSLVVDPHKGLFLPYGTGAALVRRHGYLKAAFQDAGPYLAHDELETRSPADYSFELTRHNRAPRIQLSLDLFGAQTFAAALQEKLLLAQYLFNELTCIPGIQLLGEPSLSIVVFRGNDDAATDELLERIQANGEVLVSTTRIHEKNWIRACILSFRTHLDHVKKLVLRARGELQSMDDLGV